MTKSLLILAAWALIPTALLFTLHRVVSHLPDDEEDQW